jgi:hypothetical protein
MQADITEQGVLVITPTTPTEEAALAAWTKAAWLTPGAPDARDRGHYDPDKMVFLALPRQGGQ